MDHNSRKKLEKALDVLSKLTLIAIMVVGVFLTVFIVMAPKMWH